MQNSLMSDNNQNNTRPEAAPENVVTNSYVAAFVPVHGQTPQTIDTSYYTNKEVKVRRVVYKLK